MDPLSALKQGNLDLSLADRAMGLVGIACMIAIAYAMSYDRRRIPWRLVGAGLALQGLFGVVVLKTDLGRRFFEYVGGLVGGLLNFSLTGARFVFGNLVASNQPVGWPTPQGNLDASYGLVSNAGAFFAFAVLPTVIFFSALMSVLYHLGIMQVVVKGLAWGMQRTLGTSGAETLSASGNIFLGQTEAPLLIKPFVKDATPSELLTIMVGGFATVAGGVMAAYVLMLQDVFPNVAGHLLAASVMNAPAALLLSKIIHPENGVPRTKDSLQIVTDRPDANVIEAAASGSSTGVALALNIGGMLMAFIALIAALNFGVGFVASLVGFEGVNIQTLLGTCLRPLAWVMGVPWQDTGYVGGLIGVKITLNEFVSYAQFAGDLKAGTMALSPRSAVIAAYALLGFANFSSIGIQIGGIGGLAPERRSEIARFGLRAMIAGNLAAFMSASLAGMLL